VKEPRLRILILPRKPKRARAAPTTHALQLPITINVRPPDLLPVPIEHPDRRAEVVSNDRVPLIRHELRERRKALRLEEPGDGRLRRAFEQGRFGTGGSAV